MSRTLPYMGSVTTFTFRTSIIIVQPEQDMVTIVPRINLFKEATHTFTIDETLQILEEKNKKTLNYDI